jgi:cell division protein FtsQ
MRKGFLTILIICLLGGIWFAAQSWSKHLGVSRVAVYGTHYIDEDEIVKLIALPESVPFEEIDLGAIQERVKRHPYVKTASVNRDFPSAIRVRVVERNPAALLVGSRMAVIDDEKIVMPVRHGDELRNLIVLSGSFAIPQTGDTLRHEGVDRALQIIRATAEFDKVMHHLFSEISIVRDGMLIAYTADGGVPVLLGRNIAAKKLLGFREFWLREVVPVGADQIQSIDLRFDGQIVTRWRTSR